MPQGRGLFGRREDVPPADPTPPDDAAAPLPDPGAVDTAPAVPELRHLRLGLDPGVGPGVVAKVTTALRSHLEADRIRVVSVHAEAELRLRLRWPAEPDPDGVEIVEVGHDRILVATSSNLGDATRVPAERLVELDLVVGPTGPHDERALLKLLSRPAHRPEIHHRFDDTAAAFAFLRSEPEAFMVLPQRCAVGLEGLRTGALGAEPIYAAVRLEVDAALADDEDVFPLVLAIHGAAEQALGEG